MIGGQISPPGTANSASRMQTQRNAKSVARRGKTRIINVVADETMHRSLRVLAARTDSSIRELARVALGQLLARLDEESDGGREP